MGSPVNYPIRFGTLRSGCNVIDVYRDLDLGQDGAGGRFRSWNRGISGVLGPIQATLSGKDGFQGHGAGPATKCSTWNMGISGAMGHGPIGDGEFGTWGSGGPDEPSGRAGRWLPCPGQPARGAYAS